MGDFESGDDGASFVDGFLVFAGGDGIGDDTATSLNVGAAIFGDQGAQRDAGIEIAGKIEIENCASVNAAAGGLEFVDDLHGANFWRAGNGAGRKAGHERVKTVESFAQLAAEAGDEMHDVGVALDEHQLVDGNGAVFADPAEIVATEINEHDVFGAFFGIGEKIFFEGLIFGFGTAARNSAGDGAVGHLAVLDFHQHFGRTADDGHVTKFQEIKIRRRIDDAESAENFEWVGAGLRGKALAGRPLKNSPAR